MFQLRSAYVCVAWTLPQQLQHLSEKRLYTSVTQRSLSFLFASLAAVSPLCKISDSSCFSSRKITLLVLSSFLFITLFSSALHFSPLLFSFPVLQASWEHIFLLLPLISIHHGVLSTLMKCCCFQKISSTAAVMILVHFRSSFWKIREASESDPESSMWADDKVFLLMKETSRSLQDSLH